MTMPPKPITVRCPKCGIEYQDWWRPSINLTLDNFDDDYIEEATTSTCPHCHHKVHHGALIVGKDQVWRIAHGPSDALPHES